jgi:hypothetical protein
MTSVQITVTNRQVGTGPVVPYSHSKGLQFYRGEALRPVVYSVPVYELRITSGASYAVVRFGLHNRGDDATPRVRACDAGLHEPRDCTPSWMPHYSPHSFHGGVRAGAWQLLPGKGFLIHEGANRLTDQVAGSIGCIEVLDGRWNTFLAEIERIGGGTCYQIAASRKLSVKIEFAPYPQAVLRSG